MQEYVPLAPLTTLGIGGPARYFVEANKEDEILTALAFAEAKGLPALLLGGGSNLVIGDAGFPGVVIRLALRGITAFFPTNVRDIVHVTASAGEEWDGFVRYSALQGWAGIECLAGIPGTVGATPVQNVGAYGQEVADTLISVRACDRNEKRIQDLSAAECDFAYRRSRFNSAEPERWIILSVTFALRPGGAPTLKYADLIRHFGENATPTLPAVYDAVRVIRARKGMVIDPSDPDSRSVGSFFKNPTLTAPAFAALTAATPEIPHYPQPDGSVKIPAAYLIENSGFSKGQRFGNVALSSKHILALINRGGASASEIVAAAQQIQEGVEAKWGIRLLPEPLFV